MSNEPGHQGWANYNTWCVALWLDNEESTYKFWQSRTLEVWSESEQGSHAWQTPSFEARYSLANELKASLEAEAPDMNGMWADLLGAALSEVDWEEIAESLLEAMDTSEVDCPACEGSGTLDANSEDVDAPYREVTCEACRGSGNVPGAKYVPRESEKTDAA